jgi:hypothetical protein
MLPSIFEISPTVQSNSNPTATTTNVPGFKKSSRLAWFESMMHQAPDLEIETPKNTAV